MQPRLTQGSGTHPGPPALVSRLGAYFARRWSGRIVGVAILLLFLEALLSLAGFAMPEPLALLARLALGLYVLGAIWWGFRWLADRLLWRIRTKLILSYLFIGLVPVVLLGIFFVTAFVLLLVVSASRLVVVEVDRIADLSRAAVVTAIVDLPADDQAAGRVVRERLATVRTLHPRASWTLLRAGRVVATEGEAPRSLPGWWTGGPFAGLVPVGARTHGPGQSLLRAAASRGDVALIVDLPADEQFFDDLEQRAGIHVLQPQELGELPAGEQAGRVRRQHGIVVEDDGRRMTISGGSGLAFIALPARWDWQTGVSGADDFQPFVFRFQPLDFVRRLSPQLSREPGLRSLSDILLVALGIVGLVFLVMYGVALLIGLFLARSITRGVHELSLGTQRLRQGDFDHAIPIRSRDQLGELAESFNHMSRGLKQLIAEQGERQRLEEELRIARQIQMSLLPGDGLVRLSGVRIAALCLPAAEVGGDYYDLLPLDPTRMGLLIADVSGKGTSAALYMAELKGLVLSLSRIYDSPARLLSEANRILSANMDSRSFVTMAYAVVDSERRCMRYARAGHNPILHLDARTGRTRVLAPPGLGLGLDAGARFDRILEEAEVPLVPGDFFLFFTDGLSEAMNEGAELFGEGRLRSILEGAAELGSDELKERILAEVRQFVGAAAPHDDMTMVVLKVVDEEAA